MNRPFCIRVYKDQMARDTGGHYEYLPPEGAGATSLVPWHAFDERWTGTAKSAAEVIAAVKANPRVNPAVILVAVKCS